MDEQTRRMIEAYIPSPPDPTLEFGEYYYRQSTAGGERVIRAYALDIFPGRYGTEYGIYKRHGAKLRRVNTGYDGWNRGVHKSELYDNRQDCLDQTHMLYDGWEALRGIQREEGERDA